MRHLRDWRLTSKALGFLPCLPHSIEQRLSVTELVKPSAESHHSSAHYAAAGGSAYGAGSGSDASTASDTFVGGGMAGGVAGSTAEAQTHDASIPHAFAETHATTAGGDISTSQTGTMSGDLLFGPSAFSGADSVTFASAADLAPVPLSPNDAFSVLADTSYGHIA